MLIKKEILLYEEEKYFSFFYMCVVHLGMCVFKCVCVCRPDIDVGSLPDHCLLYLLRQGLPLNAESLDSASLAKLDCLASVSHKQGLQGAFYSVSRDPDAVLTLAVSISFPIRYT